MFVVPVHDQALINDDIYMMTQTPYGDHMNEMNYNFFKSLFAIK